MPATARKPPTAPASQLIDPNLIPPCFRNIHDEAQTTRDGAVRWGWRQWSLMAPRLQKHIKAKGREGLTRAIVNAQTALLPKALHRPITALSVATSPTSGIDVVALVNFVHAMQQTAKMKTEAAPPAPIPPTLKVVSPAPAPAPPPAPVVQPQLAAQIEGQDIPEALQSIPPDIEIVKKPNGSVLRIAWGWPQWKKITAVVHEHASRFGYAGLSTALYQAQAKALPPEQHRTLKALRSACSSDKAVDVLKVIEFLGGPFNKEKATGKPPRRRNLRHLSIVAPPVATGAAPEPEAPAAPVAAVAPEAVPIPPMPYDERVQGLLNMPVGAFLPHIKSFLTDALRDILKPQHEAIAAAVRQAVEDVIGAPTPTPAAAPAPAVPDTPESVAEKATEARGKLQGAFASLMEPAESPQETPKAGVGTPTPTKPPQPAHVAPHDITSQLEVAAKMIGIEVKRPTVIVCGLHPKVMDELEHVHGKQYRFQYIKQDHFNTAADLPASTDALILSRKKLNSELFGTVRRYSIPFRNVANSLPAAEWALKEIFPENHA